MSDHPHDVLTPDGVRDAVAELLGEAPSDIDEHDDLFDLGMDSIRMMALVNRWADAGQDVELGDLAENPTLAARSRLAAGGTAPVPP